MNLNASSQQFVIKIAQPILSHIKCQTHQNAPDPLQYVPAWHELHAEDQDEAPEYKESWVQ